MEERTLTLQNANYQNVLSIIEDLLLSLPRLAHIDEKPGKTITQYFFHDPIWKNSTKEQSGRITINYHKNITTQYASMAGLVTENDPMIFECSQDAKHNHVIVKGYCSTHNDSKDWLKPIFDKIMQDLLDGFSS
jgi:hypothetical protein